MKVFLKNTKVFKIIVSLLIIVLLNNFIFMPKVKANAWEDIKDHIAEKVEEALSNAWDRLVEQPLAKAAARILLGIVTGLACLPEGIAVTMNNAFCAEDVSKAKMLEDSSNTDTKKIKLSPESIINGKFAIMNANIFKKITDEDAKNQIYYDVSETDSSIALSKNDLRTTIAKWYQSLRNFSVVALLSVLVYVAIRMVISSASTDKAKYKIMLKDWFVALCLVVLMHFMMIAIINISSLITEAIGTQSGITKVEEEREELISCYNKADKEIDNISNFDDFKGDFIDSLREMLPHVLIYAALVAFTVAFVVKYMIRALTIVFLTLLAPITAITYPIDKIGDGKSQAYDMWFKEYFFNVIIQPFHLLIYVVLIGAAQTLADKNIFYCILCYAMIFPAEKIIKQMFGLDRAKIGSPFAASAAGATAANLMNKARNGIERRNRSSSNGSDNSNKEESNTTQPKQKSDGELEAYTDDARGNMSDSDASTSNLESNSSPQLGDSASNDAVATVGGAAAGAEISDNTSSGINSETTDETQQGTSENVPTREIESENNSKSNSNSKAPNKLSQMNRGIRNEIGKGFRKKYGTTDPGFHGIRGTIKGFKESKGQKFRVAKALKSGVKGHFSSENRNSIAAQALRRGAGAIGRTAMKGGMAALGAATAGMFAVATGDPKTAFTAMAAGAGLGAATGKRINGINSRISSGAKRYVNAGKNAAKGEGAKRKEAKNNYLQNQEQRDYVTQRLIDKNGYMPSSKEINNEMNDRWRFIEDNGITDNNILDAEVDMMKEKEGAYKEEERAYFDSFKSDGYDEVQNKLDGTGKENKEFRKDYKKLEEGKIAKFDMDEKYGKGTYDKSMQHMITNNKYAKDENKEKIKQKAFAQTSYAAQLGNQYKKPEFRDEKKMGQLSKSMMRQGASKETANRVIRDAARIKGEKNPNI